jgi:hypothetical protein
MPQPELKNNSALLQIGEWVLLFAIAILAALRFFKLDFQSPWVDEIYTLMDTNPAHSVWQSVHQAIVNEGHPPLYFFVVTIWNKVLGSSTENVRYLSALLGVGSLVLIYRLGKDLSGKETGLLAALLLAANHSHIYYSQEARSYTLSFCLILLLWLVANRYYSHRHIEWLGATVFVLILGALNSVFVFFIANLVMGSYALLLLVKKEHKALIRLVLALIIGNAIILPTYYYISNQYSYPANSWLLDINIVEVLRVGSQYLFYALWVKIIYLIALLTLFVLAFRKQKPELLLVIAVPVFFIVLAYIFSILSHPILAGRYLVFLLPFTTIALAFFISQLRFALLKVAIATLIIAAWLGKVYTDDYFFSPRKSEFRPFYAFISGSALQQLPVLCTEYPLHSFFIKYMGYNARIYDEHKAKSDIGLINEMARKGWVELYLHRSYNTDSLHQVIKQSTPFKSFYFNRFSTIKVNIPDQRCIRPASKEQVGSTLTLTFEQPFAEPITLLFALSTKGCAKPARLCKIEIGNQSKVVLPDFRKSLHCLNFEPYEQVDQVKIHLPDETWQLDDIVIFR